MITATPTKAIKSNEWYTPPYVIEAAREVIGPIDLDPASCSVANGTVKATRYFDVNDDGLSKAWDIDGRPSRIWLNPPYGKANNKSMIAQWLTKLIKECEAGNVSQAIALVIAYIGAQWFAPLWKFPICFATQRIHFYKPEDGVLYKDSRWGHIYGSAFVYLGPNIDLFDSVFSAFGHVVLPR